MTEPHESSVLKFADGRIDMGPDSSVVVDGEAVPGIQGPQLEILRLLVARTDHIVLSSEICEEVWGEYSRAAADCLQVHVMHIRKKLGPELGDAKSGSIETVQGQGYRAKGSLHEDPEPSENVYTIADGRVSVDQDEKMIWADNKLVNGITPVEYRLARELACRPNTTVGVRALMHAAYDDERMSTHQSIQNHIMRLRMKLGGRQIESLGHFKYGAIRTNHVGYFAVSTLDLQPGTLSTGS